MQDRFKFRTYIPDLKFFKYWGWIDKGYYIGFCASGDYSTDELLEAYTQQSTGLKDKNGKLIYEGDILKIKDVKPYVVVRYKGIGFELYAEPTNIPGYHNNKYIPEDCEIVGNIYENQELLKSEVDDADI